MPQSDAFVGIDVAKAELVIHLHPDGLCWRVANTKAGLATLGRKLVRLAGTQRLRIGFEASGGYERKLAILLDRLKLTAYLLDPARVRSFARAERQLAKTDPLDVALIARCLTALHAELTPYVHDPVAVRLAEHVRLRDLAIAQAIQLGNQLETVADAAMRRLIAGQVARLKAVALRIEQAIAKLVAASPTLAARERLLRSAPGVGPIVAACLLARMPELGTLSSRQVAALAGLAPFDRQSGAHAKPGRCSGGRPAVRRALYLAALAILRSNKTSIAESAKRLRTAGKPYKLAAIAVARKLLVTPNAMIKNNTTHNTQHTTHNTPYAASRMIMGKSAVKSVQDMLATLRNVDAPDGYVVPANPHISATFDLGSGMPDGLMVPNRRKPGRRALLDGNFARRKHPVQASEYCIWDTELPGFGLRIHPTGRYHWFVRLRHRGKHRRITLGRSDELDAALARTQARRLLAEVALDGLPKRTVAKSTPELTDYVETYWTDIARYWKPSTAARNRNAWRLDLASVFGSIRVADIVPADVIRWRDECAGADEARFNRALPVLASLLKYAEQLHLRRKGSNPCRGTPRYKRQPCERYLSPLEYRRLGAALRAAEAASLAEVSIIRLLLYTGARVSEIRDLRWEWVRPPHLALPDSKTGAKTIWLNSQALAILDAVPRRDGCPLVFPNRSGAAPVKLDNWWNAFRRTCSMPDVRIHDLRHSYASTAIMDNVPLATIGKLLGHLLPETTAKYAHLSDDVIADAAQRISGSLAEAIGLRP